MSITALFSFYRHLCPSSRLFPQHITLRLVVHAKTFPSSVKTTRESLLLGRVFEIDLVQFLLHFYRHFPEEGRWGLSI